MKISINKSKVSAMIVMILMIASIAFVFNVPVKAQLAATQPTAGPLPSGATPSITIATIPYLSFTPNPIGVGQTLLVNMWLGPPTNLQRSFINAYQVTLTKPDGTTDVIGPISSYAGDTTAFFSYTVDQVGNWTVQFNFLGMYYPAGQYYQGAIVTNSSGSLLGSAYYNPASTPKQSLVVQSAPIGSWPPAPLPTDYWTRPVPDQDREWWVILGNYPGTGYQGVPQVGGAVWNQLYPNTNPDWSAAYAFVPFVTAPTSAHVVWDRQRDIGGLIGGQMGIQSLSPDTGVPSVSMVYAGRCYQTVTKVVNGVTQSVWECYDLRTGQIYWDKTGITQYPTTIDYEQKTYYTVEGAGAAPRGLWVYLQYIGGGYLVKYDPFTGAVTLNVTIAPLTTGTLYKDEFALSVQNIGTTANPNYRLINWTTNDAGLALGTNGAIDTSLANRVANNITWPISSFPSTTDYNAGVAVYTAAINPPNPSGTGVTIGEDIVGINIYTGQVMWNVTTTAPDGHEQFFSGSDLIADNGVFIARMITGQIIAWSLETGAIVWTYQMPYPWGVFGAYNVASAYGLYFSGSYAGFYALNETNGNVAWVFHSWTPYQFEQPYQMPGDSSEQYPWHKGILIADGMVYVSDAEHSPKEPIARGLNLFCLNVTNGDQLWNFSAASLERTTFGGAAADGYLIFDSNYNGMEYVFGMGQSATTVTATPEGTSVLIQGTVLDKSPGDQGSYTNPTAPLDNPTTVYCVSDASMPTYMDYLYDQIPIPIGYNMTGVPVLLYATDQSGNTISIGTATTGGLSGFSYAWTPPSSGLWTIHAVYAGDDSYGSSYAGTAAIYNAPTATATPTPTASPTSNLATTADLMTYIIVGVIAMIIAIAIATVLILRKKP